VAYVSALHPSLILPCGLESNVPQGGIIYGSGRTAGVPGGTG
jgi:hypothetical protein